MPLKFPDSFLIASRNSLEDVFFIKFIVSCLSFIVYPDGADLQSVPFFVLMIARIENPRHHLKNYNPEGGASFASEPHA